MIKKIIILIVLLSSIPSFAIEAGNILIYPVIGIGKTAGIVGIYGASSSTHDADPQYSTSRELSINADLFLAQSFALSSGVGYTSKPIKFRATPKVSSATQKELYIDAKYTTIPLLLSFVYQENDGGVFFKTGFIIGKNKTDTFELNGVKGKCEKTNDLALSMEVGGFSMITESIFIIISGQGSLSMASTHQLDYVFEDTRALTGMLRVGAGVKF